MSAPDVTERYSEAIKDLLGWLLKHPYSCARDVEVLTRIDAVNRLTPRVYEAIERLRAPVDEDALRAALTERLGNDCGWYVGTHSCSMNAIVAVLREAGLLRPEVER